VTITASDALLRYLTAQVEAIETLEPLVREDVPDALHKMRVACRRLGSCLLAFDDWFEDGSVDALLVELKWLGAALAETRDLEVVAARVLKTSQRAGIEAGERLGEAVLAERATALRASINALDDERFIQLKKSLREFLDEPQWSHHAHLSAKETMLGTIAWDWARVARDAHQARTAETREGHEERLHDVRKRIRRLRYVTEVARPVLGRRCGRFTRHLVRSQDILGRHNDAYVASAALLRICGDDPDTAVVVEQLGLEATRDDEKFMRAFGRFERSWLRRHFT
jgi:CHAD domain-containing protein